MSVVLHPLLHRQARPGEALVIELESMPGAGLLWRMPPPLPGCSLVEVEGGPSVSTGGGIGGGRLQRFVLTCHSVGMHRFTFELLRPWESEVRGVQPVEVDVR
jgi:hypothetical protein